MRLFILTLFTLALLSVRPAFSAQAYCNGVDSFETVLSLLSKRLDLAADVARYKWNLKADIEDSAREQLIIKKLVADATAKGLPADWSEQFFRAQIEASKSVQRQLFGEWQKNHAGTFADVPDLNSQTRPKLYALMSELIDALTKAWQPLHQEQCKTVLDMLVREKLLKPEYKAASKPLFEVR